MNDIVKRLQAPAHWISGSDEGHYGENDAPREAADTIIRLTAENEKLRAALQWQPIETAPKDGTEIIVYRPDAGVFGAFYSDECWFCTYSGEDFSLEPPTHWMHLPPPPALKENNDG